MNQKIVKIADLSNFSNSELENVTIKATVSMKSIRHGNSRHAYFYMDLRDDSGEITAVAYSDNEPSDNQLHIIEENKTYIITNISLENSNKRYTSIQNEKEIVLNNNSVVKLCGNAPKFEWPLTPLNEAYNQDEAKFFNIVGLCTGVTETKVVLGELTRQVTLVDESHTEVILNVWNQETSLFDELVLNLHPVFFVKDARTYKDQGRTSLTTSRYLRLLYPDDPRAAKIIEAAIQENPSMHPDLKSHLAVARQPDKNSDCTPSTFTKNNRNYVKIADLSKNSVFGRKNVSVIATVTMKSKRTGGKEKCFFYFDLRDDSGEILAIAYDDECVKFQHLIETNKTYSITGFIRGVPSNDATSIPHQNALVLRHRCDVKLCGNASKVEWPMSPITEVHTQDKTKYFHAFGLLTKIEGRRMTLVDQFGRELLLDVSLMISMFEALDLNSHPVIFVKDAKMTDKKYKGSTVLITNVYLELLDPDDPRARRVTDALCPVSTQPPATVNE